ncbi:MAG: hypothetical protein ACO3GA_01080, partial [Candidatus Limnocylindrus sp.]
MTSTKAGYFVRDTADFPCLVSDWSVKFSGCTLRGYVTGRASGLGPAHYAFDLGELDPDAEWLARRRQGGSQSL